MSSETSSVTLKRALLILFVVALAGAAGYAAWRSGAKTPAELGARVGALWRPSEGPLILQGNVEVRQVNLGFKVAGRIEKLLVDEGDQVKAGQPLATLETVYFRDALDQTRASRDSAAAAYAKMKAGNRVEDMRRPRRRSRCNRRRCRMRRRRSTARWRWSKPTPARSRPMMTRWARNARRTRG